jgi:HTH-type transcriptional regulator/antitoxin HigA
VIREKLKRMNGPRMLIPEDIWNTIKVKDKPTPLAVMELAQRLGIHPAIIAGRIQYQSRNFRLLSHCAGTGTLRKQFLRKSA